ncbi:MAG: 4-(cytidine 5'-diphospho)-2-C-methyl-D-erythritol kinase [Ferruginibacter sp.]
MLVFPNCKINIGLTVIGRRIDGYHDIETIFYPVNLRDALEILPASKTLFTQSGIIVDSGPDDNLCTRAYRLLKADFPQIPHLTIHLHKAIPIGAGLGGGSADAAFTLMALNEKFKLNLSYEKLLSYALQLGSDCPFFILNKPCLSTGRGEILQPLPVSLTGYRLVLVHPAIHINTGWAFSQLNTANREISPQQRKGLLQLLVAKSIDDWKDTIFNEFEWPIFAKYPAIGFIKSTLYDKGALFASMSGSGSTVYAIFANDATPTFDFPSNYLIHQVLL